jgi:uncharacterized protein
MSKKLYHLRKILAKMKNVLVAYSGGVDSTLLLKVAQGALGEKVLAVTATSLIYPSGELEAASQTAERLGIRHLIIRNRVLSLPNFLRNPRDRCYWCKKELFSQILAIAKKNGISYIIEGSNYDDRSDFRPGKRAVKEFGVRSPLDEAKLTKEEIRRLAKKFGLPVWNKPAFACLASRIPYGIKITRANLKKIEASEELLREVGIKGSLRVRDYGSVARIEILAKEFPKLLRVRNRLIRKFKALGYTYITLDLEGYRSGSMNEIINKGVDKK